MSKPSHLLDAEARFISNHSSVTVPVAEDASRQRSWDELACQLGFNNLLSSANQVHSARLRAAASPHTGAWLQALPSSSLGLHLDGETVRINVALRLGAPVFEPHKCRCGRMVSSLGHHGLACGKKNEGRGARHYALNDIVKRSLRAAGVPSWLEPLGLDRGDGKRPDGLTVFPFTEGKCLTWDATCTDTFCKTAINEAAINPGAAATKAEQRKRTLYSNLQDQYRFEPLAIETTGVYGKSSARFISELGRRISGCTGDKRETHWLRQRLAIAVVRGNAKSIHATGGV